MSHHGVYRAMLGGKLVSRSRRTSCNDTLGRPDAANFALNICTHCDPAHIHAFRGNTLDSILFSTGAYSDIFLLRHFSVFASKGMNVVADIYIQVVSQNTRSLAVTCQLRPTQLQSSTACASLLQMMLLQNLVSGTS